MLYDLCEMLTLVVSDFPGNSDAAAYDALMVKYVDAVAVAAMKVRSNDIRSGLDYR